MRCKRAETNPKVRSSQATQKMSLSIVAAYSQPGVMHKPIRAMAFTGGI